MRHGEISRDMFPRYPIDSITNGVHAATWTSPPFQNLYDRFIPEWRRDNFYLRYAISIPLAEVQRAHRLAKREMLAQIDKRTKRPSRRECPDDRFCPPCRRLQTRRSCCSPISNGCSRLPKQAGPIQVVFGGKAHPRDEAGKEMIRRIFECAEKLKGRIARRLLRKL